VSGGFVRSVTVKDGAGGYALEIPAIRNLGRLELDPAVTFLVGENGSGKSTLVEAIAVAAGLNAEGGGLWRPGRFSTRASHSELHRFLELERPRPKPVNGFFLRAESFYNFATAIEAEDPALEIERAAFETPLHEQSHGESFLALTLERFGPGGFYVLDEPEAALSVNGQLALMRRMFELVRADSQLVVATHSPILVGYPEATIYQLGDDGFTRVEYKEVEQVALSRLFLEDRDLFLRHLLAED
jgi:predicted ATPase